MPPFFSVIIPTYNRSKDLLRAINSVLAQTFTDYEILVMDDGSTDDTPKIVEAITDPRIVYDWDINFGGPARPRNRGISKAKGQWICFLDADDYWMPHKLQVCYDSIANNVDVLYHPLKIDSNTLIEKKINTESRVLKKPVIIDLVLNGNAISNSSAVVRKTIIDCIGDIDESIELIACEDYNTWIRIAEITDNFVNINQVLGYYSVHENNISAKDLSVPEEYAYRKYMHLLSPVQIIRKISIREYSLGKIMFRKNDFNHASQHLAFSLRYAPYLYKLKSLYLLILVFPSRFFRRM